MTTSISTSPPPQKQERQSKREESARRIEGAAESDADNVDPAAVKRLVLDERLVPFARTRNEPRLTKRVDRQFGERPSRGKLREPTGVDDDDRVHHLQDYQGGVR